MCLTKSIIEVGFTVLPGATAEMENRLQGETSLQVTSFYDQQEFDKQFVDENGYE